MAANELKALKDLNLVDRFLFDETMEIPELYQMTVSIILENEIELIYYTEMQKKNTGNLVRRSRFYQSQMDVSLLEPGSVDFNMLNDTSLILIAPFDIFGRGLYRYTFEGVCRECPDLKLEDGATRIFINTKGTNRQDFSQEFLDFMEYLMHTSDENAEETASTRIKSMHKKIQEIRTSEERGVKYMQKWEERVYDRLEGKAEGKAEGRAIRLVEQIQKKCAKGKSLSQIADEVEEEQESIRRYYDAVFSAPEKSAEEIVTLLEEKTDEVV